MNAEFVHYQPEVESVLSKEEKEVEELDTSLSFSLDDFFSEPEITSRAESADKIEVAEGKKQSSDLLTALRTDAAESIVTLSSRVTAETFATGLSFTSGVFSALSSVVGSCGVFCAHGLGSIVQVGSSGLAVTPNLGSLGLPGLQIDSKGNFHMEGNVDSLSKVTGISKEKILSGQISVEDILMVFFSAFGEGLSAGFGFGLIDGILGSLLPGGSE